MAVDSLVSRLVMEAELSDVQALATTHGWGVVVNLEDLRFTVKMKAHTGDVYVIEVQCDDYKEKPPLIEFLDPDSGERGARRAYPQSNDSLFHSSGPCICAPFSRKAYKSFADSGPHSDWPPSEWTTSTSNGVSWVDYSRLGDILGLIQTRISRPGLYIGRMK